MSTEQTNVEQLTLTAANLESLWDVFLTWVTQPEVFFPLAAIHLFTFLLVSMSKHFLCQWSPLMVANAVIYWFNRSRTEEDKSPYIRRICANTRKTLTILLALSIGWFLSSAIFPDKLLPFDWIPRWIFDMGNGLVNPVVVWALFKVLPRLGPWGKSASEWLGARDADFYEERAEAHVHEGAGEEDNTTTRFVVRSALGIGRPPAPRKGGDE